MNYTNGPWLYLDVDDLILGGGRIIAKMALVPKHDVHVQEEREAASAQFTADANLISAAPEMYEALKAVIQWHRDHDEGDGAVFGQDFVTTCISAVRKAEGRG